MHCIHRLRLPYVFVLQIDSSVILFQVDSVVCPVVSGQPQVLVSFGAAERHRLDASRAGSIRLRRDYHEPTAARAGTRLTRRLSRLLPHSQGTVATYRPHSI